MSFMAFFASRPNILTNGDPVDFFRMTVTFGNLEKKDRFWAVASPETGRFFSGGSSTSGI